MKRITYSLAAILCGALFPGCGGGGDAGQAVASSPAPIVQTVHELRAIIRPDSNGTWYIQNDSDHASIGIVAISQTSEYIELLFDRTYSHASTVQVTPDDDFNGFFTVGSNLGLSAMRIRLKANGVQINPANVYSYGPTLGGGNLWVNVTMVQR